MSVVLAEVTGVDLNARSVDASQPGVGIRKIQFDYLVIATGMRPSYFGHDEFARFAPGLKSLSDAETFRARILSAYELADATDDETERARQMTFVLVGAGATGVELAASMAHWPLSPCADSFSGSIPCQRAAESPHFGARNFPHLAGTAISRLSDQDLRFLAVDRDA